MTWYQARPSKEDGMRYYVKETLDQAIKALSLMLDRIGLY